METAAAGVYVLCLITSTICAALLMRAYVRRRTPILFWGATCFAFLSLSNLLLVMDMLVLPQFDLRLYRSLATFVGVGALLYGFIFGDEK